ncbi:MAG: sulfite oxidase [Chitinophagales bacterium]|nr:sulfite oxidase [Chitinophagales bacterium]
MNKHKSFLFHTNDPVNAEPSIDYLCNDFETPQELFYVRNHGAIPLINIESFRLKIKGLVENEIEFTYQSLLKDFTKHTVMATLQCAGNRRDQLIAVAPVPGEVPWQSGAVGNATWGGVRLNELLKAAGLKSEAKFVEFLGADDVYRNEKNVGFAGSIPINKAMENDVLVAFEMNGKTLEPTHGYPLRIVTPGYIGARSVKWVKEITLIEHPSLNYFQDHAYRLFPPQATPETVDWNSGLQLNELTVNCVITSPKVEQTVNGESVEVRGFAISGGGKKISRVDVSTDGGNTWTTAIITDEKSEWTWSFWKTNLKLEKGDHVIIARAFDSASNTQPSDAKHIWNFKGYMNNAWHRVKIIVE